jgi:hypothetical protein
MASDTEDPDTAADRLEAALERIAQVAHGAARDAADEAPEIPEQAVSAHTEEMAARLDALIDRLRTVLGGRAG